MTNDPVLLALIDLCEQLTYVPIIDEPLQDAYAKAMKVIRERTNPGGECDHVFMVGPNAGDKWKCVKCPATCDVQPSIPPQHEKD